MGNAAIVGAGQSEFSRRHGMRIAELAFEAFNEAMQGLRLEPDDIDATIMLIAKSDLTEFATTYDDPRRGKRKANAQPFTGDNPGAGIAQL